MSLEHADGEVHPAMTSAPIGTTAWAGVGQDAGGAGGTFVAVAATARGATITTSAVEFMGTSLPNVSSHSRSPVPVVTPVDLVLNIETFVGWLLSILKWLS